MDNNFFWNLDEDFFIAHAGRAHDENPPGRGSGRYPWGSGAKNGKTPIHEHGEKKHKTSGGVKLDSKAEAEYQKAVKREVYQLNFLEKIQNVEDIDTKTTLKEYKKYLSNPDKYERPPEDLMSRNGSETKNNDEKKSLEGTLNADFDIPKNIYKKNILGRNTDELTEEGKRLKKEIATRADAYYDLMDDNNLNERLENHKEWQRALNQMDGKESTEDRRKYYDLDNKHSEYLVEDYNNATNNKFVGNPSDADDVAFRTFAEKYYEKMQRGSIEHSSMDKEDYIVHASIIHILNTPIY